MISLEIGTNIGQVGMARKLVKAVTIDHYENLLVFYL